MALDWSRDAATVAVIGTGAMGRGIAQVAAQGGFKVLLFDAAPGAAEKGRAYIAEMLDGAAKKGRMDPAEAKAAVDRIRVVGALEDLAPADAVIEASIRAEPRPEQLGVVSNDNQVREAGRVRGCRVYRCEEFVDWLIAKPVPMTDVPGPPEKVEPVATPDEMATWLDVFAQAAT